MLLEAEYVIGPMRGKSRSQLVVCADKSLVVVKLQGNPQGTRVLACEYLAGKMGRWLGLPIPECAVISVDPWLLLNTDYSSNAVNATSTLHFASRYVGGPGAGPTCDYLPASLLDLSRSSAVFVGMLVLDKWLSNKSHRQAVFHKAAGDDSYSPFFIDQGDCFCGAEWNFSAGPEAGLFSLAKVYSGVTGLDSFEPFLSRMFELKPDLIWDFCREMPRAWCQDENSSIESLIPSLIDRVFKVCRALETTCECCPKLFPNWRARTTVYPAHTLCRSSFLIHESTSR